MALFLFHKEFGSPIKRTRKDLVIVAAVLLWILSVGAGLRTLWVYSNTPGRLGTPPPDWPRAAGIKPTAGRATLVLFAHPRCPCTRATVEELAVIMTHCPGKLDAYVLFLAPRTENSNWVRTGLWRDAGAIPNVRPLADQDGDEARLFGASTSGQALLYDTGGHLLFDGGITGARGHVGENAGMDTIISLLEDGTGRSKTTPVFGCSLRDESKL